MNIETIIEIMDNKDMTVYERLDNEHKATKAFINDCVTDVFDMATDDEGNLMREQLYNLIDDKLETYKQNILDALEKLQSIHTLEAETHLKHLELIESC